VGQQERKECLWPTSSFSSPILARHLVIRPEAPGEAQKTSEDSCYLDPQELELPCELFFTVTPPPFATPNSLQFLNQMDPSYGLPTPLLSRPCPQIGDDSQALPCDPGQVTVPLGLRSSL
jgi:hypothetical protein